VRKVLCSCGAGQGRVMTSHTALGPERFTIVHVTIKHTRFVQKVSGLTTVHEVDKAYGVFNPNCLQHSSLPQLHTSLNVAATVGNILRTPLSGCRIVSSSNFV
jgi:hypothetical protein